MARPLIVQEIEGVIAKAIDRHPSNRDFEVSEILAALENIRFKLTEAIIKGPSNTNEPMEVNSKEADEWMDLMRQGSELEVPKHERARLERLSTSELIAGIERHGFQCEVGPLANFTEWTELKERIANYEPPDPPGFEGGFADNH